MRRLFPREETFFDLFNQAAANVLEAAHMLRDLLDDYRDVDARTDAIKALESKGGDDQTPAAEIPPSDPPKV